MSGQDSFQKAESRGYARGYAAGRRKRKQENATSAFWQRAFLAALPACIAGKDWAQGEKKFVTLPDKINLAKRAADYAVIEARCADKL